jgi:hypothetical protein
MAKIWLVSDALLQRLLKIERQVNGMSGEGGIKIVPSDTILLVTFAPGTNQSLPGYHEAERTFVDESCAEFTDTILVKDGGPTT